MARPKKNAAVNTTVETAAEKAAVELSSPAVVKASNPVASTVVVALNNPTGITFDLSGNRRVTIKGNAEGLRGMDKGHIPVGAFGLTEIAKNDWDEIVAKYGHMRIFHSPLLRVTETKSDALAEAEEKKDTRHGREPIDPKTDPQLHGRIVETSAPAE